MSEKPKEILITDFMEQSTSYLKEEIAQLSELSMVDVIQQLQTGKEQGIIELTKLGDHEFWSKLPHPIKKDTGDNAKPDPK